MPYIKKREADNIKKQICALYNNGGDWRALAKTLGVKTTTSYRWVNGQNVAEKQRGGNRRSKITNEHRNFIEQCVEQNTRITLKQMKEKLMQTYQIAVSVECVRKHLDGMLFTLKNIRREPENANNEINKRKRRQYVEQLIAYQSENRPIIYMDETNFNLFISRTKGRSRTGSRCSYIAAGCRGANVHMIGCIGNVGLIHHEVRRGAFKTPQANEFIRNCLRNALTKYQSPVVMVIDNAPCHTSIEDVFLETEFINHRLLRLGPYSPMLNPIELAWSALKASIKGDLATEMPQILAGENRTNLTQTEFRLQRIENIIQRNVPNLSVANCVKYVAYIQKFIPDVLRLVDMIF